MKKNLIILLIIVANLLLIGFVIAVKAPTFNKQIAFNSWLWNHGKPPFGRIRYYMSESLVDSLNNMRPNYMEAHQLLGEDLWDTWPDGRGENNNDLWYHLKSDAFIMGWDEYGLMIKFDEENNFKEAYLTHAD